MLSLAIDSEGLERSLRLQLLLRVLRLGYVRHIWLWVGQAVSMLSVMQSLSSWEQRRDPLALIFVPPFTDFSKEPDIAGARRDMEGKLNVMWRWIF